MTVIPLHGDEIPAATPEQAELEADWPLWLATLYPAYCREPFADYHCEFWDWLWAVRPGLRPRPQVNVWPRGAAKSTNAELGVVALGARRRRKYGLYVCRVQEQADDHVGNVAGMLESSAIAEFYPLMADRMVGKYGASRGWRRNRLRTASGFTLDGMGLDSAARGAKLDEQRPDFIILDDIDGELDSTPTVEKLIRVITRRLLPAGSSDAAVLAVQNLIHPESVFSRLVDGRADFLADRVVNGPVPAVEGLEYEQLGDGFVITAGRATWAGMDMRRCQEIVNDIGITAFLGECQHDVEAPPGGMFDHLIWSRIDADKVPNLVRVVVWVDPAVTNKDDSDAQGIQADGLGVDGKVYRLYSYEHRSSPLDTLTRAVRKAIELKADEIGVETDQGGDTWESVYREAVRVVAAEDNYRGNFPTFRSAKAGEGHGPKTHRAGKMLAYYERGRFVHVRGTHQVLERALRRFPKTKPFDLADAAYWSSFSLLGDPAGPMNYRDERMAGRR